MDFTCSQCGTPLSATATEQATVVVCTKCGHVVRIPHDGSVCTLTYSGSPGGEATTVAAGQDEDRTESFVGAPGRPAPVPAVGQRFGDYELLGEIARGGMGVVFRARQAGLNRLVAVKMILSSHLATAEQVRRFRTEAENAAKLDHPGIVPVYEVGERDGQHFFSMGLVEGGTLSGLVENGPLPPRQAAALVETLAEAMQFAHARNIVHRDLKPANVLLDEQGQPKITDFGLAKNIEDGEGHTLAGQVMGTPSYMAPEQAEGRVDEVGPLADVYALGGILYFLLTKRPPFRGDNIGETLRQVIEDEPVSPRQRNPRVDVDLATICLKCLEKPAGKRYASAGQLAEELRRYLNGEPITARPVGRLERAWRWARRHPARAAALAASVVAVLALVVVGVGAGYQAELQASNDRLDVSNRALRQTQGDLKQTNVELDRANIQLKDSLRREKELGDQRNILLAHIDWKDNHVGRARSRLAAVPPARRRWEWKYVQRLCSPEERTFYGHRMATDGRRYVYAVAVSPDGNRIASAGLDQRVVVWDLVTRQPLVLPHRTTIRCLAFSPHGKWIASGGFDRTAIVWDAASGEPAAVLKGHEHTVLGLAFHPDGNLIATAGADQTVRLWEWDAEKRATNLSHTFAAPDRVMHAVEFDATGGRLAASGKDGAIVVWDVKSNQPLMSAKDPTGPVFGLAFSPEGQLASTSFDNTVKLWNVPGDKPLRTLGEANPRSALQDVAYFPDGKQVVAASEDGTVTVWDVKTGQRRWTLRGHTAHVRSVAVTPAGKIASTGLDGTVKLWNPTMSQPSIPLDGHRDVVTCVAAGPNGKLMATGSADGTVIVRDLASRRVLHTYTGHAGPVNSVAFSPDGKHIASGGDDQTIHLWDATTGKALLPPLKGHAGQVFSVAFHGDDERTLLASASADGGIILWDATTGGRIANFTGHAGPVRSVAFNPDGARLASASDDKTVKIWDVASRRVLQTLEGHSDQAWSVAFSPDGKRLASAGRDSRLRIWDAETGDEQHALAGHGHWISSLAFSPNGARIATSSLDGTIRLWDPNSGLETFLLKGHTAGLVAVAFTPDGRRILSASVDQTARIWTAGSDAIIATLGR